MAKILLVLALQTALEQMIQTTQLLLTVKLMPMMGLVDASQRVQIHFMLTIFQEFVLLPL